MSGNSAARKRQRKRRKERNRIENRKMCGGKISYKNKSNASYHALIYNIKFDKNFRVYKCPICNNYHLTTH